MFSRVFNTFLCPTLPFSAPALLIGDPNSDLGPGCSRPRSPATWPGHACLKTEIPYHRNEEASLISRAFLWPKSSRVWLSSRSPRTWLLGYSGGAPRRSSSDLRKDSWNLTPGLPSFQERRTPGAVLPLPLPAASDSLRVADQHEGRPVVGMGIGSIVPGLRLLLRLRWHQPLQGRDRAPQLPLAQLRRQYRHFPTPQIP